MSYSGSISILNDDSEVIFERELTHEEMIDAILAAPKLAAPVEVEVPVKIFTKGCSACGSTTRHKKDCIKAKGKETRLPNIKPCCGSLGRRHYKTCSRSVPSNNSAPSLTSVGKSLDEADKAWSEFEPALTPLQFSEIKDLAIEQAMNSVEIIGELNLPADQLRDVNFVIQSKTYQTYLSLARKAALG